MSGSRTAVTIKGPIGGGAAKTRRVATDRILKVAEDEGLTGHLTKFMERLVDTGIFSRQDVDADIQMSWIRGTAMAMRSERNGERGVAKPTVIRTAPSAAVVGACADCGAQGSCSRVSIETGVGSSVRTLCADCIEKRREEETRSLTCTEVPTGKIEHRR